MAIELHTSDLLTLPPLIPGYAVIRGLGSGGMGTVYLARPLGGGPDVAIKCCAHGSTRPDQVDRFRREIELLKRLHHPRIIKLLDHSELDGRDFFVMEYAEGGTLRGLLHGKPLALTKVQDIVAGIGEALEYLQSAQVVHRDLKPENVFFASDGRLMIGDFGISKILNDVESGTMTGQVLGTIDYMAPEQRARLPVDSRADQFSLAVMTYEMLTGKKPLGSFKPASEIQPRLHPNVDLVLLRALQQDPDDRFSTISEFTQSLQAALSARPSRSNLSAAVGAGIVAAACVTASVVFIVSRRPEPPAIVNRVLESVRDRSNFYLNLGDQHAAKSDPAQALTCYTEAIRVDSTNVQALLRRALLHKKSELPEEAIKDLQAVLVLDANNGEAHKGLGTMYVSLKAFDKAGPHLAATLSADPKDADALAYRGWMFHNLKQVEAARADLDAAVSANPNNFVAHQFRALFANAQGEYQTAIQEFREAIRCDDSSPFAHSGLALLLATCRNKRFRNPPEALIEATRACELTQWKDWKQLKILGQAQAANGDRAAAISTIEKAMALAPALSQKRTLQPLLDEYQRTGAPAEERRP